MKKFSILFFVACLTVNLFGQAPQSFKYQAVARDLSGNVLANKLISFRISILSGSVSGKLVYSEAHNGIVSNTFGLIDLAVGKGIPLSGSFASISWGTDNHFVRIELDPNGGSNYSVVGSCQLLSVPYALYAEKSGSSTSFLPPVVTAGNATGIDLTSATLNGTVNGNGFKTEVTFEWGTSTLFGNKLKAIQDPVLGNNLVSVSLNATGLQPYTTYYYRISASNAVNTVLSNVIQFSTGITAPTLTTKPVTSINQNTAQTGGDILSTGGASIIARGVCWNTTGNPTIANNKTSDGTGAESFTSNLSGLTPATTYYIRAYATNSEGTGYGSQVSFTTSLSSSLPAVTTQTVSSFTFNTANVGGNVTGAGSSTVTERGVVYGTSTNPTLSNSKVVIGNGLGTFSGTIDNLVTNTPYYVRAYATNSSGTSYGNEQSFTLNMNVASPTVTDIDGNIYKTVKIGSQIWMAENLKTKKYRDGTAIPYVTDNSSWINLTSGSYCYYGNSPANGEVFGNLYNFYAVTDSRQICPNSWHVPTVLEWTVLENFLGTNIAGLMMKTTQGWSNNGNGTNASGFTGLPGGDRDIDGGFWNINAMSFWWTSTEFSTSGAWMKALTRENNLMQGVLINKISGFNVRCIKDDEVNTVPTIGQTYQGGIVAYILQPGDPGYKTGETHGLIASTSDLSSGITWGNSVLVTGTTGSQIGTGSSNTDLIVSSIGSGNYAAKLCYDYVSGEYSDWYLPSLSELVKLFGNKNKIGGFSNQYYWSSTRYENNAGMAANVSMNTGTIDYVFTSSTNYVRAIRSF